MQSEEIYYIIRGQGTMSLGDEQIEVKIGDTVLIPRKTAHRIKNTGEEPLNAFVLLLSGILR